MLRWWPSRWAASSAEMSFRSRASAGTRLRCLSPRFGQMPVIARNGVTVGIAQWVVISHSDRLLVR